MKKIEEAARKSGKFIAQELDNYEKGFEAGARYVLDAMMSEAAMEAFIAAASTKYGDEGEALEPAGVIKYCIAAVRKEIEGE